MSDVVIKKILNRDLRISDVPAQIGDWIPSNLPEAIQADWGNKRHLCGFATTFDAYEFIGTECLTLGQSIAEIFGSQPLILKCLSMSGLRVCLFAEYRQEVHNKDYSDGKTSEFVRALALEIKSRLAT